MLFPVKRVLIPHAVADVFPERGAVGCTFPNQAIAEAFLTHAAITYKLGKPFFGRPWLAAYKEVFVLAHEDVIPQLAQSISEWLLARDVGELELDVLSSVPTGVTDYLAFVHSSYMGEKPDPTLGLAIYGKMVHNRQASLEVTRSRTGGYALNVHDVLGLDANTHIALSTFPSNGVMLLADSNTLDPAYQVLVYVGKEEQIPIRPIDLLIAAFGVGKNIMRSDAAIADSLGISVGVLPRLLAECEAVGLLDRHLRELKPKGKQAMALHSQLRS